MHMVQGSCHERSSAKYLCRCQFRPAWSLTRRQRFYTRHLADPASYVLAFWRGKNLVTAEGEPPRPIHIDNTASYLWLPQEMPILGRHNDEVILRLISLPMKFHLCRPGSIRRSARCRATFAGKDAALWLMPAAF